MREMTGMLVTATAAPNTSVSDQVLCAGPSSEEMSTKRVAAMPAANGTTSPAAVMTALVLAQCAGSIEPNSAPALNRRSSRPIW